MSYERSEELMRSDLSQKVVYQLFLRVFTKEGTLRAAAEKLDDLAALGIDLIYLCPICEADSNENRAYWSERQKASGILNAKNPYRISDFFKIDPEYGTDDDLRAFVEKARKLGMGVLLDLVYMHCGPGKFPEEHPDFVQRDEQGGIRFNEYHFPLLNFDNPALCDYLWENMCYWVREFGVSGYRCDVGDAVPVWFWEEGRRRIEALHRPIYMINEGAFPGALLNAFDCNYDFIRATALKDTIKTGVRSTLRIPAAEYGMDALGPRGGLRLLYYDNHDIANDQYEERFDRVKPARSEAALVLNFMLHGVPMLYNGNEFADCGRHSIWNLPGGPYRINWDQRETEAGKRRLALVKTLCDLRHQLPVLQSGSTVWGVDSELLCFTREYQGVTLRGAFNFQEHPVPFSPAGGRVLLEKTNGAELPEGGYIVEVL